jgi:hypothetical protein
MMSQEMHDVMDVVEMIAVAMDVDGIPIIMAR